MSYYDISGDDDLVEVWDRFEALPERGSNPALDAFVERKHVSIEALVRLGARLADYSVLAFAYPGGIKYRDMVTDHRWSLVGSEFKRLKIVAAGAARASTVIVAEGETDAARLTMLYPEADIAVLPAGADPGRHAAAYAAQLNEYDLVLLAQDHGRAGDHGAAVLQEHVTTKMLRWLAPLEGPSDNSGWGDVPADTAVPALPAPNDVEAPPAPKLLVSVGELLTYEPPEIDSWYEQALLPITGQAILHGALKSFKSFLALDWAAALAQSQPWCGFEPVDEPARVAVMQFEIPYQYFRQRIEFIRAHAAAPELLDENLLIWTPQSRPRFVAGNTKHEDAVLRELDAAGVNVLVVDPIRRGVGMADLNSEKEVRPMLHFFERCQNAGVTVIATHHDNKAGARGGGGTVLDMTGSGAFGGDADTIVSVALPHGQRLESPERELHFLLRNAPSPSARSMRMTDDGTIEYGLSPVAAEATPGAEQPPI